VKSNHFPPRLKGPRESSSFRPQIFFLALSSLFIVFFWIWFLFFRTPVVDTERDAIQSRGVEEILSECNASVAMYGLDARFRRQDIATRKSAPVEGVSPLVSMLEVSRDGLVCHWDGIGPAKISRVRR